MLDESQVGLATLRQSEKLLDERLSARHAEAASARQSKELLDRQLSESQAEVRRYRLLGLTCLPLVALFLALWLQSLWFLHSGQN